MARLLPDHSGPDEPVAMPDAPLTPKTVREAVTFLLKAFGEYPDELRIGMYIELLEGCTTGEVWDAVKTWSRQPHDRAAKGGELRDMVMTARGSRAAVQLYDQEWQRNRATPEEKQEVIAQLTPKARAMLREACPWLFQDANE